jgi:hypothetical protein
MAEAADMSEADIRAAQTAAEDAENRRREVAGASPGLGALLPLEQPPSGAGVGIWDVDMPVIGEGYEIQAEIATAVHKAYGEARPVYAGPAVAGESYVLNVSQPALRHVTDLGADGLFIEGASMAGRMVVSRRYQSGWYRPRYERRRWRVARLPRASPCTRRGSAAR